MNAAVPKLINAKNPQMFPILNIDNKHLFYLLAPITPLRPIISKHTAKIQLNAIKPFPGY